MSYHRLQLVVHQPQLAAMLLHGDQGQGSQRTLQVGMLPAALQQQYCNTILPAALQQQH